VSAGRGERSPDALPPNTAELESRGPAHLRALAGAPRPTGGAAVQAARRYCADVLTSLGLEVVEQPFEYSAAVGELGTPLGGVAMLLVIAAAAGAALGAAPAIALGILFGGAVIVTLAGRWLGGRGVLAVPFGRRRGVNLEARPRGLAPRVWLVAHVDSKSQPISLIIRAGGIVLLLLTWLVAAALAAGEAASGTRLASWGIVVTGAIIGAAPVVASVVGRRSPGAVDNASGVATVLAAAELSAGLPIGVLITDAEELGLAGARAWCASASRERVPVLNCDGVDDAGVLTLMWTRPRAVQLEHAFISAANESGQELRSLPLIPGVLVDGLAFSDDGWEVVTLSRGCLATLRRIHTPADDLERMTGTGVVAAARVLATAARLIVERP
jgi:hypothetical protein